MQQLLSGHWRQKTMEVQDVRRLVQYISVASNSFTFVTSRLQFTADYITGSRRGRAPAICKFYTFSFICYITNYHLQVNYVTTMKIWGDKPLVETRIPASLVIKCYMLQTLLLRIEKNQLKILCRQNRDIPPKAGRTIIHVGWLFTLKTLTQYTNCHRLLRTRWSCTI